MHAISALTQPGQSITYTAGRVTIAHGVITPSGLRELARLDTEATRRERIACNAARLAA